MKGFDLVIITGSFGKLFILNFSPVSTERYMNLACIKSLIPLVSLHSSVAVTLV